MYTVTTVSCNSQAAIALEQNGSFEGGTNAKETHTKALCVVLQPFVCMVVWKGTCIKQYI